MILVKKRWRWIFALTGLFFVLAALCIWMFACDGYVTQGQFGKIKVGMTRDEVLQILGPPIPEKYTSQTPLVPEGFKLPKRLETWDGFEGTVVILYDRSGLVADTGYNKPGLIKVLGQRLIDKWQKLF
jgi:hypothetical protein